VGVDVEKARPGDESAIGRLIAASVRASRRGMFDDAYLDAIDPASFAADVRACIDSAAPADNVFVAREADELRAYARTGPWLESDVGRDAYLADLYVAPSHFRQGLGTRVLRLAETRLAALGFEHVHAWVVEDAVLTTAFYDARSWSRTGRFKLLDLDRPRRVQLWTHLLTPA
jgi:GNAT superfamily N-acetyltransferase